MPNDIGQSTALDLFEAAPCGYLFTEPDGTITRVNKTFLELTGFTETNLVGRRRFQELLSGPARIFYETHFSPLLHMQGFVKEITVDLLCARGGTLPALVNSYVKKDALGGTALICTAVFDIRERRRYERELLMERRKAEQLAHVVKNASDAVITVGSTLVIETWNRGAQALFGYSAQEAVGRDIRQLLVPTEKTSEFEDQLAKLRAGEPINCETTWTNRKRELLDVWVTVSPNISPPDEFLGFSVIMHDIRQRKRAEEIEQSKRDLALANRLAHEINNPLQSLVNCLSILSLTANSEYLPLAEEQAKRIAEVVLDVARLTRNASNALADGGTKSSPE